MDHLIQSISVGRLEISYHAFDSIRFAQNEAKGTVGFFGPMPRRTWSSFVSELRRGSMDISSKIVME